MASVTWPPLVTAAPISSSVKVARARPGTAAARRPMRVARTGGTGTAVVDIGRKRTKWRTITPTAVIGSRRHARRPDDPRAHPWLPVRPGRAGAGALPRRRLQPSRPALRRAAGAPAADRRGRRGRPALPLAPRLGASGRLRGGRHAARPRPRTAQRQSVLPGTPPDLLLSGGTQPANAQPQTLFPVNFRLSLVAPSFRRRFPSFTSSYVFGGAVMIRRSISSNSSMVTDEASTEGRSASAPSPAGSFCPMFRRSIRAG